MRARRVVICAIAAFGAASVGWRSGAAADPAWGVAQLMAELAQIRSASGQFTERKTVHLLTAPLLLSGRLAYVAPNHLEKVTISPTPEKLVMDGDQVTIVTGANDTHTFSVAQYSQIGGLIVGIRATLAGDLPTIERFYTVDLAGTPTAWDLRLLPKDAELTRFVKRIEFRGSGDRIETISTEAADGDRSDMSIVEDGFDVR